MVVRTAVARARRDEDKEGRRRQLLDAALALFLHTPYAALRMAEVAQAAGLAKGTLFLYFPTKEALFLALLEERLGAWFARLDALLSREAGRGGGGEAGRWSGARVARCVVSSLEGDEPLLRLVPVWQTVLEHNVTREQLWPFKERLVARQLRTGALLEQRLPFLAPGEGARLLVHVHALVSGLRPLAEPAPVVRELLQDPRLAPLQVAFAPELTFALTHLLRGLEARASLPVRTVQERSHV
jgi:AcrR family transcriptional regulator